jgi:hypothetical protein
MVPSLDREKEVIASWAETRGLLRLPVRVELPRNVFYPSVLSVRCVPGRRISSNAIPAKGLFAPRSDRAEDAECNAPPSWVLVARPLLLLRLG